MFLVGHTKVIAKNLYRKPSATSMRVAVTHSTVAERISPHPFDAHRRRCHLNRAPMWEPWQSWHG
jgi:hypothetical protein